MTKQVIGPTRADYPDPPPEDVVFESDAPDALVKEINLFARMPYFRRRSVETQVTIADGSTVVMGGLVDETTETFRDQVPILGDIPYLGRLFRSEGTRSVKKNLVIYVTAKQVDASGMSIAERRLVRAGGNGTGAL